MMSITERYRNDTAFKNLVDMMEAMIHRAEFSPSEIRLAAMQASINYEMMRLDRRIYVYTDVEKALKTIKDFEDNELPPI